jgi:hypothetical protein
LSSFEEKENILNFFSFRLTIQINLSRLKIEEVISNTRIHSFHMAVADAVSQSIIQQQEPPTHILQTWCRKQANFRDHYLLRQTFLIAPDAVVPSSKLRQHIKNIYDQRVRSNTVVHYDPWTKEAFIAARAKTAPTKALPANADAMRSHTII